MIFKDVNNMETPSKEMQDWSKFAWEKGDVLVNKIKTIFIIFEGFEDDNYTTFKGKHCLTTIGNEKEYTNKESNFLVSLFDKAKEDDAQTYIKRLGGKLNRETLEIEKQPEFRDGDVLFSYSTTSVFIFSRLDKRRGFDYYVALDCQGLAVSTGNVWCYPGAKVRYATVGEKQKLFDALAKEGKAWDAEKKLIVDLKPKVELKPFDKVLVRDNKSDYWRASLFSHINENGCYCCMWASWRYCISYEGNESLLGTTKDVEG